nr:flagellar type III secretion system protein FlhB [Rhodobacter sp. SGA-6-6]
MAGEEDEAEKEYAPSERRLTRAREEGDVARSEDLQASAGLAGLVLALMLAGGWAVARAGQAGMVLLDQPDRLTQAGATALSLRMIAPFAALLLLPAAAVLLWLVASRSLIFAPTKLAFKGSRLSILSNARQKFGRAGLIDFAKRFAKMLAVAGLLAWFLSREMPAVMSSAAMEPGPLVALMARQLQGFLILFLAVSLAFGLADFLWQKLEFARRHRMTRKEMTDEMKESEGDPHFKADRRRRAQEIATNRMLADVPKADVVIVNPTHYAVALKWARGKEAAPRCVAKGTDEIAARIRERAQENGVPIRRDPPTARTLFATVEIGREIRPEHYAAVAAAIRFADAMRRKARRQ